MNLDDDSCEYRWRVLLKDRFQSPHWIESSNMARIHKNFKE